MTTFPLTLLAAGTLWLAWSNGANDNFKGVATLYGSRSVSYRPALAWATLTTVAGNLASVLLAHTLMQTFSGHGLIPPGILNDSMLAAIVVAASATVLLATLLGMPTSTTHALIGALVGAALIADTGGINWVMLAHKFAQPLLLSPLLAIGLTVFLYPILHYSRRRLGITAASCLCVGETRTIRALPAGASAFWPAVSAPRISVQTGTTATCAERYDGRLIGLDVHTTVDTLHFLSAGAVCFARALNDTPKIAALWLAASTVGDQRTPIWAIVLMALAMATGGLIQSRKVAETMSRHITDLNTGQGLTANLVTASLVLGASHLGVPVSTTHVVNGAIFGIGAVNGKRNWRTIGYILLTWVSTLPLGLALGAGLYWLLRASGF